MHFPHLKTPKRLIKSPFFQSGLMIFLTFLSLNCWGLTVEPVTIAQESLAKSDTPYSLDLDRNATTTPNGNLLSKDHLIRSSLAWSGLAEQRFFIRLDLSDGALWHESLLHILIEEGNQPTGTTIDFNQDGEISVLKYGEFIGGGEGQSFLIVSVTLPQPVTGDLPIVLGSGEFGQQNGVIVDTAGQFQLDITQLNQEITLSYSVYETETEAFSAINAQHLETVTLIKPIPQFAFQLIKSGTAALDSAATPAFTQFVEEGESNDILTSNNDADVNAVAATFQWVNRQAEIEDAIQLTDAHTLSLSLAGNFNFVTDTFLELDGSGPVTPGIATPLTFNTAANQAVTNIIGTQLPNQTFSDKWVLRLNGNQGAVGSYNLSVSLKQADNTLLNTVLSDFIVLTEAWPDYDSLPPPDSTLEMITPVGTPTTKGIDIHNVGETTLTVSIPNATGTPVELDIAKGESYLHTLTCNPQKVETLNYDLVFTTNDPNQPQVNYLLICQGTQKPAPEIAIQANNTAMTDGIGLLDFGQTLVGNPVSRTVVIENIGSQELRLLPPDLPTGFQLSPETPVPLALEPKSQLAIKIILEANYAELFSGEFSLPNNDDNENPFNFVIKGQVDSPPPPPVEPPPVDPRPVPISSPPVLPPAKGEEINSHYSHYYQTLEDVSVGTTGSLSGVTLTGEINNQGLIANVTIDPDGRLQGGKLSSVINNQGVICNATLTNYSQINGGDLCDQVTNHGIISNVRLLEDSQVTGGQLNEVIRNQGTLCNVQLGKSASVFGGRLACRIQGHPDYPARIGAAEITEGTMIDNVYLNPTVKLAEGVKLGKNVYLPPVRENPILQDFGVDPETLDELDAKQLSHIEPAAFALFSSDMVAKIPPEAFAGLYPEQLAYLSKKALWGLTVEQFQMIPLASLEGFHSDNMLGLHAAVMYSVNLTQLQAFNPNIFQDMDSWGVAKFLTNLDLEKIQPEDVIDLLPEAWSIDRQTNRIIVPDQSHIEFKSMDMTDFPNEVKLHYDLPNYATSFGVGGVSDQPTMLEKLNATLAAVGNEGSEFIQRPDGIIVTRESGEDTASFIPNVHKQMHVMPDAEVGLSMNEQGHLVVTTPDYWQITLIPAPRDYYQLAKLLKANEWAQCYENGEVVMQLNVDGEPAYAAVVFDAEIESFTASDGEIGSYTPGIFIFDEPERRGERNGQARVVFTDGSTQKLFPTLLYPHTFMDLVRQIPGVENITMDFVGFHGQYLGQAFSLEPTGVTEWFSLGNGEIIQPTLELETPNSIIYNVQDGSDLAKQWVFLGFD